MELTPDLGPPRRVRIDGVDIASYVLGPREGESRGDVVFCHGTPWSSRVWAQSAQALSRSHRVHLWDMPGYGLSIAGSTPRLDLEAQMARCAELLDHWQLDRPHVIAHDIGGAVALGAHLLHGSEYAGLFLWDVVVLDPWGSPFFRLVADHAEVFAQLPEDLHEALVTRYIQGATPHPVSLTWLTALTRPWLGQPGQRAFYRQIAALRPEHTRRVVDRLPQVRCATAIGWGAQDPWIPSSQATQLQGLLPGGTPITEVDGVGHLAPIEAPARVIDVLSGWLAADPGAAQTT